MSFPLVVLCGVVYGVPPLERRGVVPPPTTHTYNVLPYLTLPCLKLPGWEARGKLGGARPGGAKYASQEEPGESQEDPGRQSGGARGEHAQAWEQGFVLFFLYLLVFSWYF